MIINKIIIFPLFPSQPSTMTSGSEWPSNEARLYLALQWTSTPDDQIVTIRYDADRRLLKVVDAEQSILHVFDPLDIIGVEVEIKLFDSGGVELNNSLFRNAITDPSSPVAASCSNIFDPVSENKHSIFSRSNDEDFIPVDSQATAVLNIYTYPKSVTKSPSSAWWCSSLKGNQPTPTFVKGDGPRKARHYSFPVAPAHDFEALTELVHAIRRVAQIEYERKRKYLVILNPHAGTGQANKVWETTVQPMLEQEAGIDVQLRRTQYSQHATEIIREEADLSQYDAIVCMGGDGMIHEMLQGLKLRHDSSEIMQHVKLGILGCGTANGLAKSLTFAAQEHHSITESTFMIARGQTTQMDLSLYETTNQSYWSFLTFTFAMIADLDFESEVLRWLGSIRLEIWAVFCVARMRSYPARLSYLPKSQENAEFNMPSLSDPVPADWKVVEDDILLLWSSQVTHASESHYHSPPSHIHDGVFQILLVRGRVSRISMANILLSLEYGTHINHPKAEFIECAAYRLEPLKSGSFNDLDGELIEGGPVQAHVLPSAIQVFCSLAR